MVAFKPATDLSRVLQLLTSSHKQVMTGQNPSNKESVVEFIHKIQAILASQLDHFRPAELVNVITGRFLKSR